MQRVARTDAPLGRTVMLNSILFWQALQALHLSSKRTTSPRQTGYCVPQVLRTADAPAKLAGVNKPYAVAVRSTGAQLSPRQTGAVFAVRSTGA
jgi:hypothetical protein